MSEPTPIEELTLGTTFVWNTDRWDVNRRWTVREADGACYLEDEDGRKWLPGLFDPSTIRDVQIPKEHP